jgi:hypothetical protein
MVTGDQCLEDTIIDEIHQLGAEVYFKPLWLEDLVTVVRKLAHDPPGRISARRASFQRSSQPPLIPRP